MKSATEFTGTLQGFDDYVNMVLSDVTEYDYSGAEPHKMKKALVNGNNVCMVSTLFYSWFFLGMPAWKGVS